MSSPVSGPSEKRASACVNFGAQSIRFEPPHGVVRFKTIETKKFYNQKALPGSCRARGRDRGNGKVQPYRNAAGQGNGKVDMRSNFTNCAIGVSLLAAAASPAFAQDKSAATPNSWIDSKLHSIIRSKSTWEDVRHKMLVVYLKQDLDGGGISQSDFKLQKETELARGRMKPISNWVSQDLDGSGDVTRTELESVFGSKARTPIKHHGVSFPPSPEQSARILEKLVSKALEPDGNNDGKVTFEEALEHAKALAAKARSKGYRYRRSNKDPIPMSLDHDRDGIVSEAEYMGAVDHALAAIDQDSDHKFSHAEINTLKLTVREGLKSKRAREREQRIAAARKELADSCAFPKAPANAQILLLGTYEGEALSTVTLGGDEAVVTTANIKIEPGTEPLYVVLSSSTPMIWQFSGSTDRIAHAVAGTSRYGRILRDQITMDPRVGVTGLPADRVFIPTAGNCMLRFTKAGNRQSQSAATALENVLGRAPDIVTGRRKISTVQLPSSVFSKVPDYGNTVAVPQDGPTAPIWRKLLRLVPGGLVRIKPESVVARATAKTYTVLPKEAGLAQLVDAGALQAVPPDQSVSPGGTQFIPDRPITPINPPNGPARINTFFPREFVILKKITFPAGLTGRHAAQFVLKRGVPRPSGSSGSSKIKE